MNGHLAVILSVAVVIVLVIVIVAIFYQRKCSHLTTTLFPDFSLGGLIGTSKVPFDVAVYSNPPKGIGTMRDGLTKKQARPLPTHVWYQNGLQAQSSSFVSDPFVFEINENAMEFGINGSLEWLLTDEFVGFEDLGGMHLVAKYENVTIPIVRGMTSITWQVAGSFSPRFLTQQIQQPEGRFACAHDAKGVEVKPKMSDGVETLKDVRVFVVASVTGHPWIFAASCNISVRIKTGGFAIAIIDRPYTLRCFPFTIPGGKLTKEIIETFASGIYVTASYDKSTKPINIEAASSGLPDDTADLDDLGGSSDESEHESGDGGTNGSMAIAFVSSMTANTQTRAKQSRIQARDRMDGTITIHYEYKLGSEETELENLILFSFPFTDSFIGADIPSVTTPSGKIAPIQINPPDTDLRFQILVPIVTSPPPKPTLAALIVWDMEIVLRTTPPKNFNLLVKMMYKIARLIDLAEAVRVTDKVLIGKCVERVQRLAQPWLISQAAGDAIVYDPVWGCLQYRHDDVTTTLPIGICGYFLAAIATICSVDISFFTKNASGIVAWIRYVVNLSSDDDSFTPSRFKDWWTWRSDGTIGEVQNCYHAVLRLGVMLKLAEAKWAGQVLFATEAMAYARRSCILTAKATDLGPNPFLVVSFAPVQEYVEWSKKLTTETIYHHILCSAKTDNIDEIKKIISASPELSLSDVSYLRSIVYYSANETK